MACGSGFGPGIREFLGPVKWHRVDMRVPFGAQKTRRAERVKEPDPDSFEVQDPDADAKISL